MESNSSNQQNEQQNEHDNQSNELWQQAGATEDEEMDDRIFEIYDAPQQYNMTAKDDDDDENDDDDDDDDDKPTAEDWGDVDPQPSGNSGMDPSGPGSAV